MSIRPDSNLSEVPLNKTAFYGIIFIFLLQIVFAICYGGKITNAIHLILNPDQTPLMNSRELDIKLGLFFFFIEVAMFLFGVNLLRELCDLKQIMVFNIISILGLVVFIYLYLPVHECYAGVKHILSESENHFH